MRFERLPLRVIAEQNRKRDEDLARLATGWTPSAEDLAGAPVLSYWVDYKPTGTTATCLFGHMKGHPRELDGWVQTDVILARGEGWVRLSDTFVRLGLPMPPRAAPRPYTPPTDAEVDDLLDGLPRFDPR